jgi:GxxExxY protein
MSILNNHNDMPADLDALSKIVIDPIFCVHKEVGPGYLEKIYEGALVCELRRRGILFTRQKSLPVYYRGELLPTEFKIDLMIADQIILELKTVEKIIPVHEAQIISYMKQSNIALGFIVNLNTTLIKDGIKRVVLSQNLRSFASSR